MKFDFMKFFVGFAGGSMLVNMLVVPCPVFGSLFIGVILGILLEASSKDGETQ